MEIINILPRTLVKFKYPDLQDLEVLRNHLLKEERYHFIHSNFKTDNNHLHKEEIYKKLFSWVDECLDSVRQREGFHCDSLKVTQAWANLTKTNQFHHAHIHPNSVLSGIFYVTDECVTTFGIQNPWYLGGFTETSMFIQVSLDVQKCWVHDHYKASAGDLIIFPSNLHHNVNEHQGEESRVTISFNSFPSGKIGDHDELMGLNLEVL